MCMYIYMYVGHLELEAPEVLGFGLVTSLKKSKAKD